MWKENVMEELEAGEIEYENIEEFLTSLKREFGGGEEEAVKAVELRKLEQGGRIIEKFVQEFKRAARLWVQMILQVLKMLPSTHFPPLSSHYYTPTLSPSS